MNYKIIFYFLLTLAFLGCKDAIVNTKPKVIIESGTESTYNEMDSLPPKEIRKSIPVKPKNLDKGEPYTIENVSMWSGMFDNANENWDNSLYVDEGFIWRKNNKITLVILKTTDSTVNGYSVVAGNKRPFKGIREAVYENGKIAYHKNFVNEPGDDKFDGQFQFKQFEDKIEGTWDSYNGDLEVNERKYELVPARFEYDPEQNLSENSLFVDWTKSKSKYEEVYYGDDPTEAEIEEYTEYASTTDAIYDINASNTILTKRDVENLSKSDLRIIRNAIFARHGYSFKTRVLRVYFDAQPWYVPMSTDVRQQLTDLEKHNIELLLKYEKNAEEYYDYFGRG
ncbi:YARHG domain-containing protein [Nonlabens dokdonensis]|uniref:Serine/threonine protein kinase n=2 Tax=Nonlabens dokdonensis TaxID=328515 RepID=L7WDT1_NONDD|nr:YARHG domain-containing protein [Nonlabens dokdonensis]AGC78412.1 serine/threonine protein kinase [Nonlabens dokdonensis DSW-6]PZX38160.1 YARHG domain-containing protein [Nonlabens dokdonensis]